VRPCRLSPIPAGARSSLSLPVARSGVSGSNDVGSGDICSYGRGLGDHNSSDSGAPPRDSLSRFKGRCGKASPIPVSDRKRRVALRRLACFRQQQMARAVRRRLREDLALRQPHESFPVRALAPCRNGRTFPTSRVQERRRKKIAYKCRPSGDRGRATDGCMQVRR